MSRRLIDAVAKVEAASAIHAFISTGPANVILAVILSAARAACFKVLACAAGCSANIRSRCVALRLT
jgi:hypothetical protein